MPPRSSRVRGVFRARDVVPHLSSRIEGDVLALPSIREGVTGLRVTAMCDDSTVVTFVNHQGGTVSRSLCSLAGRLLSWSECLDLHFDTGYLPEQSCVLADLLSHRDQVIGAAWSLHPPVATTLLPAWGSPSLDLFAMHLPALLPLFCSLVPNSQAVFLDAFCVPWGNLGVYAFPPFLSSDGWWLESERPQSLHDSGRPPLAGEGMVRRPSPSLTRGFPGSLMSWQGFLGLTSFWLSVTPSLSLCPAGIGSGDLSYNFSMFLRNFSRTVEPEELRTPPWVVTLVLRGLTRDLYVLFWSSDECFLT